MGHPRRHRRPRLRRRRPPRRDPPPPHVQQRGDFKNNVTAAYDVFEACHRLGLRDIVVASSETVLGVPFDESITCLPLDEDSPRRGRDAYGLSKVVIEQIAEEYAKNDPELRVSALRLSYVQNEDECADYPGFADDIDERSWDLWPYIDGRDTGAAIEKALHYQPRGFETFLIVADDTVMPSPPPT
ncbi:NAD-dependent epimerase/dehydratase family protein [Streptomyces sp. NPDC017673]|uniref:NAD-dependent epimerase/dehydratase family protein n=1 Tax=unclassified Streptomyces TaxID=2593676 RepID=UPI003788389F